jgi:hypothetical protein
MTHYWLAALLLYLVVGTFVCTHAYDKDGKPMPVHHFVLIVFFWPILFILPTDYDDED